LLVGNGIDATTGEPLLPPIDVHQLARAVTGDQLAGDELSELQRKSRQARQANFAVVEGVDPNDLAQAGWAVVFAAVDPANPAAAAHQAAIRAALAPLCDRRRAEATAVHDLYREYAGDLGYRAGETKQQYLARLGAGPGPAQPYKVPYYLLLVATPEEIPFHIQYQLDVHYAVGRIAFEAIEDYARYAQSVVDAETQVAPRARRATFFGVANANDAATRVSADHLVLPLADYLTGRGAQHRFAVDRYLGAAATRDRLAAVLRDPPALLFTASHGMGFPSGNADQRDHQGALLCQDWGGPGQPVQRAHYFAGEDVPAEADLRGMIGVLFACYGAGTPARDEFTRRALGEAKAKPLAPAPLVARLPQRMLGHAAGGALAVVGHIDRAWGSTFLWIDPQGKRETQRHLDVFQSMLDGLLAGKRLGYAMEAFNLRYAELAADLSERLEQIQLYNEPYEDSELAAMWIYNNDARNYAVTGDPAVRIPDPRGAQARPVPSASRDVDLIGGPDLPQTGPGERAAPAVASTAGGAAAADRVGADGGASGPAGATTGAAAHPAAAIDDAQPRAFGWFGGHADAKPDAGAPPSPPGFLARLGHKLGEVLGNVLDDVAILEVKTYTSDDLQAVAGGAPVATSGAKLRAYTRCKLDGDTELCVPTSSGGAVDESLWKVHADMVKQAQDHRAELLKTLLALLSRGTG
jgi:hypothetical protein